MPIAVQLHIYSGRPDPVWVISDEASTALLGSREKLFEAAADAPMPAAALGYRGFSLVELPAQRPEMDSLTEAVSLAEAGPRAVIAGQPEVEMELLRSGEGSVSARALDHVASAIRSSRSALFEDFTQTTCPPCGGGTAPAYDPGYWNNDRNRRVSNNCYNYANNRATNTFAQPGRGSGQILTDLECGNVRAAAERDGLRAVPTVDASVPGWYVALVVWPGEDYHWYRQDDVGCWSHKPGQTEARNVDNAGRRITDPRSCDRGPYTDFCTYMTTDRNVTIR